MASSKVESNNFHFTLNSSHRCWIASSRSSQRARSFQTYAYVGTDSSLIYRFALGPLASFLVRFCIPRWVAPNCITLIGLVIGLSSQIAILFTTCGNLSAVASEVAARDPSCAPPPFLFAYDAVALRARRWRSRRSAIGSREKILRSLTRCDASATRRRADSWEVEHAA